MQKRKSKLVVKTLVFILIVAIAVVPLSIIFTPKWLTGNAESAIAEHYYEIEDDSLEVLFLGSSQIAWNIDTVRLYEEYGIMSYGIGGSHNPPMVNYYWLLDAIDRHKTLKTVLVDTSVIFNKDEELCADYTKNLQYMKMNKYKYNAIRDFYYNLETVDEKKDSFFETLLDFTFPLNEYHSRWNELDKVDFKPEEFDIYNMLGYTPMPEHWIPNMSYSNFVIENDTVDKSELFNEFQLGYLNRIIDTCKANNIDIILIKTPKSSWSKTGHEYIQKLADEKDVPFLEFTTDKPLKEMGFDFQRDMRDRDHLNARGAVKLADWLGNYLLENGDYTDARKKNLVSKKTLKDYERRKNQCFLNTAVTPSEFLKELEKKQYVVLLQSSADISSVWTPELQAQLEKLGFTIDISQLKGTRYVCLSRDGKCELEETSPETIENKSIAVIPGRKVKTTTNFNSCTTKFDGTVAFAQNGLRISVFDDTSGDLVTWATIYNEDGELRLNVDSAGKIK